MEAALPFFVSPPVTREAEVTDRTRFLQTYSCISYPESTMETKWKRWREHIPARSPILINSESAAPLAHTDRLPRLSRYMQREARFSTQLDN